MLWRLHLLGEDVAARCARAAATAGTWTTADAGHYAFNDVHAVLAMLGAGDVARAEAWVARCAERALGADDARPQQPPDGARGRPAADARPAGAWRAATPTAPPTCIYPVRALAQRFGGSHAQRDLIDQTLLAAAAQRQPRARSAARCSTSA